MMHGAMQEHPLTLNRFLDHAARWHPDAEVVTARPGGRIDRVGYGTLRTRSLAISGLLSAMGVREGDVVATLAWNSQAHVEVWYATMGLGALCHTLNPRLTATQIADMVVRSGARLIVVSADLCDLAAQLVANAPAVTDVMVIDGPVGPWKAPSAAAHDLERLIPTAPGDATWGNFDERAPAGLCFTSGTTGPPKGVTYTHRASFLHTLRVLQADAMAFTSRDSVLAVVPMFHANAWGLPFAVPAVGAKLVLPGRQADGASLARLMASENVTIAVGVPTVWLGVLDHLEATGGELPSLSRIIVGGAPMPPSLMKRLEERLGVSVQTSWGMTELSPLGTITPPGDPDRSAAVSGRPAFGLDLLLTDSNGVPLVNQRGEEGHLRVRGPAVVERYFGEAQRATDAEGWFPTGDLARLDAAGNLMITGRAKDLIKSGGEWINPTEIEAVVSELPDVAFAAVIGRQDPKWGERPILFVELVAGAEISDADLLAPLAGRVASWWVPDEVIRLPSIPLTTTGKIDKNRLRKDHGGL